MKSCKNFNIKDFFKDTDINVNFNTKLQKEKFIPFIKLLKVFRLRGNLNQQLIISSIITKALESEREDSAFVYVQSYMAIELGISRKTMSRFFQKLLALEIIVKVASKEVLENGSNKEYCAYSINADKLEAFLGAELTFNQYYKSIFGNNEKSKKDNIKDDEIKRMQSEILALKDEVKFRDEKIDELKKNNSPKLKKGQGIYVVAEVEELQGNFEKTREKLAEVVAAYEKLGNSYKDLLENYEKLKSADSEAVAVLEARNQHLEALVNESREIKEVTESQEYKDLAESNNLLESTVTRLTKENDELGKKLGGALNRIAELENQKGDSNVDKDEKIKELESRLESARELFKDQKREINTLKKSSGANIDEIRDNIEADIKAKFNERIETQNRKVNELVAAKEARIKELELDKENFVKEVVALKEVEVNQLKEKVTSLELELSKVKNPNLTHIDLDAIEKRLQTKFNPTQAKLIMEILKTQNNLLVRVKEKAEKEVYIPEITNEGDAKVFQQGDLPF